VFINSRLSVLFKGMLELITFADILLLVDIAHGWLEGIQVGKTPRNSIIFLRYVA